MKFGLFKKIIITFATGLRQVDLSKGYKKFGFFKKEGLRLLGIHLKCFVYEKDYFYFVGLFPDGILQ